MNQSLLVNRNFITKYDHLNEYSKLLFVSSMTFLMGFTRTQVFSQFQPDKPVCLKGLSLLQRSASRTFLHTNPTINVCSAQSRNSVQFRNCPVQSRNSHFVAQSGNSYHAQDNSGMVYAQVGIGAK